MKFLKFYTLLNLVLCFANLHAQEVISVSAGHASSSNGSTNYIVGQVFYSTSTDGIGAVSAGLEQPYEIEVILEIEEAKDISIIISAYPNPTTDYLFVKVENFNTENLEFQLFSNDGKLIKSIKASDNITKIEMLGLSSAIYLLKSISNNKEVKIFRIIKH